MVSRVTIIDRFHCSITIEGALALGKCMYGCGLMLIWVEATASLPLWSCSPSPSPSPCNPLTDAILFGLCVMHVVGQFLPSLMRSEGNHTGTD